jgi:ABC-type multidrug transport system fused ATPase/permease subunit
MIETYKKLFSFLEDKSKRYFFYFVPLLLFASLFEAVSIVSIIPLLSAVFDSTSKWADTMSWVSVYFFDMDEKNKLLIISIAFLGLFVFKNCFILVVTYLITRFTLNNQASFQQLMCKLYVQRAYPFHLKRNSADLIRDLANSIGNAFEALRLSMILLMDVLLSIAAFLALLLVEPKASIVFSIALGVISFIIFSFLSPIFRSLGARSYAVEGRVIKSISQIFGAIKEIKVLNKQNFFLNGFASETTDFAKITTLSITAKQVPRFIIEIFIVTGFLFFFALLFEMRNTVEEIFITVGLFGMVALRLMPSINRILSGLSEIKERTALVNSIYADYQNGLDDLNTIKDSPNAREMNFNIEIKLNNISYNYETEIGEKLILNNVNFKISKGQSIGIVGPSGAGKTTLIDNILGLLQPVRGEILVDGRNIFTNTIGWQKRLGYVPQQIYLIDDTVRRNIAFGIDDKLINDSRLEVVISMSNLKDVIEELPQNLDTMLGEQGVRISGGQRQRIGIARALYHDPDVIVFDEATSALDSEAEYEISKAILGLAHEKTLIIIAHRLSTVRLCEKLIFLNKGKITDIGTFDELMDINADFQRMVKLNDLSGKLPTLK